MSHLIVMTFEGKDEAFRVRDSLKTIQKQGQLGIDDYAVISKDEAGKIDVKNVVDKGVKMGAVGGGILGVLLSFIFPVAGLVAGVAGGALVGRSLDMGVDKKFVKDVSESLGPNTSALFVIGNGDPRAVVAAIEPFQGHLYQTTLDSDLEQQIRDALK
jgi:uncharacterized membrane protein